jgi:hypothetical protein
MVYRLKVLGEDPSAAESKREINLLLVTDQAKHTPQSPGVNS